MTTRERRRAAGPTPQQEIPQEIPEAPVPTPPRLIRKVLVANRGEIACRVLRTCRALGIATVAVFSDADADAAHVHAADEAVRIGESAASASYLNIPVLLAAAQRTGADAIHPGYGFLSERAPFAVACREAGITFIGPAPEVIARMGSKCEAKRLMAAAGVPVVPGYAGEDQSDERLLAAAGEVGFPLLVKASAGGGGKGMRVVARASDLPAALAAARREARAAFGDATLLLERLVREPRHIEFQIFGDVHGHLIHLGERECTIQRRHQKVIEETPATVLSPALRARMGEAAVTVGRTLGYSNAGTVEFILAPEGDFYFLEVNTRLQVEHPVTELATGLDLVAWQILVAEGHPLPLTQEQVTFSGHAIEARVYAEDPASGFLPATGTLALWREPAGEGVRVDSGVRTGDAISIYYDPLLAKVCAHGADRAAALRRLERALAETVAFGVRTNLDFLRRVLLHPAHVAGRLSTAFIERHAADLLAPAVPRPLVAGMSGEQGAALLVALLVAWRRAQALSEPFSSASASGGLYNWRNNPNRPLIEHFISTSARAASDGASADAIEDVIEVRLTPHSGSVFAAEVVGGAGQSAVRAIIHEVSGADLRVELNGHLVHAIAQEADPLPLSLAGKRTEGLGPWWVRIGDATYVLRRRPALAEREAVLLPSPRGEGAGGGVHLPSPPQWGGVVVAPMPGQVLAVLVAEGQAVKGGDPVLVLEAMKMEHTLRAAADGVVSAIHIGVGEQAQPGAVLLEIRPAKGV